MPVLIFACNYDPADNIVILNPKFKTIEDTISKSIERKAIPSFSVAVSENGKVIWRQSFGWADIERNIRATPETPYALGSLSKSFTSTALMILVEQGLVKSDDPVNRYLGNSKLTFYQGDSTKLTIDKLTNMVAGIPHQFEYYYNDEGKQKLSIEDQIRHYGIVVFPPGQVFNYSNFSPALIEQVIRNVSRQELSQFMKDKIFKPLKMNHSAINRDDLLNDRIAKGYSYDGLPLPVSEFYPKGGAGFYASVSDILRFGMFHLKDSLPGIVPFLTDDNIDILHSSNNKPGYNNFYSNGWGVLNIDDINTSLLSNGAIDGAASSLLLLPSKDISIACITNASMGNNFTDQLAFHIADILVPGYLDKLQRFIEKNAPAFSDKPFIVTDSLTGTWEGLIITYKDSIPVQFEFEKGGHVFVRIKDQYETVMNNMTINSGLILGRSFGNIPLPETEGIPHYLEYTLKQDKDELFGSISAQSFNTKRPYFLIPSYIHLSKLKAGKNEN